MTVEERAKTVTDEVGTATTGAELRALIANAVTAAVEEDRKTRPHQFVGSTDRWCEVCDEPDRDARHLVSNERLVWAIRMENEECAKIAAEEKVKPDGYIPIQAFSDGYRQAAGLIEHQIRARSEAK